MRIIKTEAVEKGDETLFRVTLEVSLRTAELTNSKTIRDNAGALFGKAVDALRE